MTKKLAEALLAEALITDLSQSFKDRFNKNETIKSFTGFLADVERDPHKYCRTSAEYLKDIFEYYGSTQKIDITGEKVNRWKIFDLFGPVYGEEAAQNSIYNTVCSFAENRVNKIILLHGPNGSSKTSLIAAIMAAIEDYSTKPEGAVFTFNWIFSDEGEREAGLGFGKADNALYNEETLAFTKPDEITFRLPCGMKDNPILLVPKVEREIFLKKLGIKQPHYLYNGELSQKSKEIFTQLAISYEGDWLKVIRHVQVERFYYSKLSRKGLVSIDPERNVDASSRALNRDQSYRIPRILAMSSIDEPFGDLVDANRGLVEYSEIFKRPPNDNKYLLTTAEWGTISLPGFTAHMDCVIFATDNEKNLSAFKTYPDWPSFNGRFAYVRVPYLLKWSDEQKVCNKIITEHVRKHVAPHTSEIFALWAILTRLRKSKHALAKNLTYVEKALMYDKCLGPSTWSQKEQQSLLRDLKEISSEYEDERKRAMGEGVFDASYEGRSGASYREMTNIVVEATHKKEYLSPLTLIDVIKHVNKNESIYDFVKLHKIFTPDEGYLTPEAIILEVLKFYYETVKKDLQNSAGLITDEEYKKLFERYIQNVKAWTKNEKIQNAQTSAWETANENLMKRIEEKLNIKPAEAHERRKELFNKIAAWALKNNVSEGVPYEKLFSDLLEILRNNSAVEVNKQLKRLQKFILQYGSDDWKLVPDEERKSVAQTIDKMLQLGYNQESLKEAVVFLNSHDKE